MKVLCEIRHSTNPGWGLPPAVRVRHVVIEAGGNTAPSTDQVRAALADAVDAPHTLSVSRPVTPEELSGGFKVNNERNAQGYVIADAVQPEDLTGDKSDKSDKTEIVAGLPVPKRRGRPPKVSLDAK